VRGNDDDDDDDDDVITVSPCIDGRKDIYTRIIENISCEINIPFY
jgi:hypothetical protein